MLDFVRVAVRTGVIAAIVAALSGLIFAVYNLLRLIHFPDMSLFTQGFGIAFWFLNYFAPPLAWVVAFVTALIAFKLLVYSAYLINLAASWVLDIFQ